MTQAAVLPIGHSTKFPVKQIAGFIILGVGASVIGALEPIFLSAMVHVHRMTEPLMGRAATAELFGMAIMAGIAGSRFDPRYVKPIAFFAVLVSAMLNGLTLLSSDGEIVLIRFFVGCCSGMLMWVFLGMIVRTDSPERLIGIYATLLASFSLGLAALSSMVLIPRFGGSGGFASLIGLNAIMLIAASALPRQLSKLPKAEKQTGAIPWRGVAALLGIGAYMGGIFGVWVYIVPISQSFGQRPAVITHVVTLSILAQVAGALISVVIGHRVRYTWMIGLCSLAGLAVTTLLGFNLDTSVYFVTVMGLGLIWTLCPSYHTPFMIAADPTRRSALFSATAQLLGCAGGPFLCSIVYAQYHAHGALMVGGGLFGLCLVLLTAIRLSLGRIQTGASWSPMIATPAEDGPN